MSNIRLYVRSIHRAFINQWKSFINIKNLIQELFQIIEKKEKITQTINLAGKKLERRREIINSGNFVPQSKVINFIR
ncbi:MAG: hypothetical protein A2039_06825 [Candidatus Melainabacteria bacterium GWA2_34_9]|nr:MAG: hypothetical protein A2039_06825 [Candidatus Melainabacteria bacterium GWA2_34_9]